ncbi:MAG: Rab family GTPase, partial [Blastocatellia bacterium]
MIQKKICLLGAFAVGKTSLVARFVKSIYSDQYITTVGVKVDKKTVKVDDREINLIVWDLAGEDEFQKVQMSYLSGASGYLLIADGTRLNTLETARMLRER